MNFWQEGSLSLEKANEQGTPIRLRAVTPASMPLKSLPARIFFLARGCLLMGVGAMALLMRQPGGREGARFSEGRSSQSVGTAA